MLNSNQEEFFTIVRSIADNDQNITSLDLSNKGLTDENLEFLCLALRNNTHLTSLTLKDNFISDKGIEFLIKALEENCKIQFIDLVGNYIGYNGLCDFILVLQQKNHKLVTLNFSIGLLLSHQELEKRIEQLIQQNIKINSEKNLVKKILLIKEKTAKTPSVPSLKKIASTWLEHNYKSLKQIEKVQEKLPREIYDTLKFEP